jgi:NTE family protein
MTTRALVLGGGGTAGIAWETGILAGLAESGADVLDADLVIGTSAGAAVAAQVTSGVPLERLLARQIDAAEQVAELAPTVDVPTLLVRIGEIGQADLPEPEKRRAYGELAIQSPTVPEAARIAVLADRLPVHEWPDRDLRVTVVDTATGEPAVFDRHSGVPLVDAVAASCAVPGVWPPVTIDGRRYMDGGMRSGENADLAIGYDKVLVLQVFELPPGVSWGPGLASQLDQLRAAGSAVEVVHADADSTAAIGENPLDPATRTPSALAGLAQGRAEADRVRAFWG